MSTSRQQSSQIEGAVPSAPGILFVLSTVLDPDVLEPSSFTDWYENTHIQEVQSTGGISSTQRYESLTFSSNYRQRTLAKTVPANRNLDFDFVTVYNMPDLKFRESEAFRGLDGQTAPRQELLDGLFKHVSFITRFAEQVSTSKASDECAEGLAPFVVTVASSSGVQLPHMKGARRTTSYKVHEGSLLKRFERSWLDEPTNMQILEFDDEEGIVAVAETLAKAEGLEVGFWALRRGYDGSERTPAPYSPNFKR